MSPAGGSPSGAPGRWALARTLSLRDWRDLIEAAATLAASHVALRTASPAGVIARATRLTPGVAPAPPAQLKRVAWLVGAAGRHLVPATCLTRSVALARVLARRGVATEIRVGVRMTDGRLDAHAWVEWAGRPLNDDIANVSGFAPFPQSLNALTSIQPRVRWR